MRLLNTSTLQFQEFDTPGRPPYAILSHRVREDDGVTLQTFETLLSSHKGLIKIHEACRLAVQHQLEWIWIFTVCVNRESSAELTEAANSTWDWCQGAKECLVYLDDVVEVERWQGVYRRDRKGRDDWVMTKKARISFVASEWFKRGWTLQELLAPTNVTFYNAGWKVIGTKKQLIALVSRITGIGIQFLRHSNRARRASVAMRMSWASKRETTKEEDMGYCLMGLFDVNMPLMYGERRKAFMRLQLEIVESLDDDSIFAWRAASKCKSSGMLAAWPSEFCNAGKIINFPTKGIKRPHYYVSRAGIQLDLPGGEVARNSSDIYADCARTEYNDVDGSEQVMQPSPAAVQDDPVSGKSPDNKTMQLACGFCNNPSVVPRKASELEAQQKVIWLRFSCIDGIWQRVDCDEFHTVRSEYEYRRDNVQIRFHVPQAKR